MENESRLKLDTWDVSSWNLKGSVCLGILGILGRFLESHFLFGVGIRLLCFAFSPLESCQGIVYSL